MPENYGVAAVRHFTDAECLAAALSWDGAGHLVGFSAECALKYGIMSLRQDGEGVRGHFPDLTEIAKRQLNQRRHSGLYTIIKNQNFMSDWKVELRYHENGAIDQAKYELWRQQTYSLLHASGLRKRA